MSTRDGVFRERRFQPSPRRWLPTDARAECDERMSAALLGARLGDVVVALRLVPDEAPVEVGDLEDIVRANVRTTDTVARHPADLVVVLLPDARGRGARKAVVRIQGDLEALEAPGELVAAYASVGRSESGLDAARRAMRSVLDGSVGDDENDETSERDPMAR